MARGGNRPGAGRRPGASNKATAKQQKAVAESGLPLDYLLSVMRDESVPREEQVDAANKAASYVHAKLASVDHKSSDGSMAPKPDRITIEAASDHGDDMAPA